MRRHAPAILTSILLFGFGVGYPNSHPTSPPTSNGPTNNVKQKDDRDDPVVKEARSDTEAVLNDLLAGKLDNDPDFAPVAQKLKGFNSWSMEQQNLDPDNRKAVNFRGILKGPQGEATF